ncbi:MAG: hypothetical protein KAJ69_04190 [Thermoplasmatales archaeon]|nr:hypothetical protein [Thermoplasmatales archaeon]
MIENRKMIVMGVIALFVGLSIGPVNALEFPENEMQDEVVNIEYALVDLDGTVIIEKFTLSEQEFKELEVMLSEFMEKIQSATDHDDVMNILNTFLRNRHPVLSFILKPLSSYKMFRNRAFIVSQGWGHKLNPFKNSSAEIYKLFNFWHYTNRSEFGMPSGTFILRHGSFFDTNAKVLRGIQIGMMTRFRGIYMYIARPLYEKSYTFFMGTAHHVVGLDFALPKPLL